jgi:hypothetical protein
VSNFLIQVQGLDSLVRALDLERDAVDVLREYIDAAARVVAGEARRRAPVDVGLLKSSINHQTKIEGHKVVSSIGTNVRKNGKPYGAFMEFGTGLVHDHPSWPRKRHVVPPAALIGWAQRKGRGGSFHDAEVIANAITRRGGLLPRRYLRGSLEQYEGQIVRNLGELVRKIRARRGL